MTGAACRERFPPGDLVGEVVSEDGTRWWFFCPGCKTHHAFTTFPDNPGRGWTFNGDRKKPTFTPSLLCNQSEPARRCHCYVRDGMIQFLGDCFHELKGKTVPVEPPCF